MATESPNGTDQRNGKAELPPRRYTNHLAIDFMLTEVELNFGQRAGSASGPVVHSRLVTTPVHLVIFERIIQGVIARYEGRFGRIPDASESESGEPRQ